MKGKGYDIMMLKLEGYNIILKIVIIKLLNMNVMM